MINTLVFIAVEEKQLDVESLIYDADNEGSTLLHLAVDSGILPVRRETNIILKTDRKEKTEQENAKSKHSQRTNINKLTIAKSTTTTN